MQLLKRIRHIFKPKAIVLMYHRIARLAHDPWQLSVTPENFEQHLQVLKRLGKLIPVKELVTNLHQKAVVNDSISITFDDGYRDNYMVAMPLLERFGSPATFFIPTGYPGQNAPFWWDELESILLDYPLLPQHISLSIRNNVFQFDLGQDYKLSKEQIFQHKLWVRPGKPPSRRCELYLAIWEQLKPLLHEELQSTLLQIKSWASFRETSREESFPMTLDQLQSLASHPLIDIGMHTVTHPALSQHDLETQRSEIAGSRLYLERIVDNPVDIIAYPYGDYNNITLSVAKQMQLKAGFTTEEKIVSNLTDPFRIGRFQVRNWNANEFEKKITDWKESPDFL